ncbi:uncharacterized protein [Parasteatoda tepidariorum]|uniref:uncharacterized protein n=1 Tax=Parasteatoda tepidariorum TaxID=114398 RepID=UPI001C72133E|nr:uncharacterized protein LOC107455433 isoform X1 [Parasteatoda tepidariorum]XP_015928481.2 uncharacterized protein LOC107455433 isoform X1 [Parasteatoda tepidariorum]XP_042907810.1 uncharacterized protein LOC107455433 isoform X1 [Parasteatoda tepidariorum]
MEQEVAIFFRKILAQKKLISYEKLFNIFLKESHSPLVDRFKSYNSLQIYNFFNLEEGDFFLYKGYVFEKLPCMAIGNYQKIYSAVAFLLNCYEPLHYLELKRCIFHAFEYLKKEMSILREEAQNNLFKSIPFTEQDREDYYVLVDDYRHFQGFYITTDEKTLLCIVGTLMFYKIVHFEKLFKEIKSRMPIEERACVFDSPISDQFSFLKEYYPIISISNDGYVSLTKNFIFPACSYENAPKKGSLKSIELSNQNNDNNLTGFVIDNLTTFTSKDTEPEIKKDSTFTNKKLITETFSVLKLSKRFINGLSCLLKYFKFSNKEKLTKLTLLVLEDVENYLLHVPLLDRCHFLEDCFKHFTILTNDVIVYRTPISDDTTLSEEEKDSFLFVYILSVCGAVHYHKIFEKALEHNKTIPHNIVSDSEKLQYFKCRPHLYFIQQNDVITLSDLPSVDLNISCFLGSNQLIRQETVAHDFELLRTKSLNLNSITNYDKSNHPSQEKASVVETSNSNDALDTNLNLHIDNQETTKCYEGETSTTEASNLNESVSNGLNAFTDKVESQQFSREEAPDADTFKDEEGNRQFSKDPDIENFNFGISRSELINKEDLPINKEETNQVFVKEKSVAEASNFNKSLETCLNSLTDENNQGASAYETTDSNLNSFIVHPEKSLMLNVEPSVTEISNFVKTLSSDLDLLPYKEESSHVFKENASIIEASNIVEATSSNSVVDNKNTVQLFEKESSTNEISNLIKTANGEVSSPANDKEIQKFNGDASLDETDNLNESLNTEINPVTCDINTSQTFDEEMSVIESSNLTKTPDTYSLTEDGCNTATSDIKTVNFVDTPGKDAIDCKETISIIQEVSVSETSASIGILSTEVISLADSEKYSQEFAREAILLTETHNISSIPSADLISLSKDKNINQNFKEGTFATSTDLNLFTDLKPNSCLNSEEIDDNSIDNDIQPLNKSHCGSSFEESYVNIQDGIVQNDENLKEVEVAREMKIDELICKRLTNGITFLLKYFDLPVNSFFFETIIHALIDVRISLNALLSSCEKGSILKYFALCSNELRILSKQSVLLKKVDLNKEEKVSLFITYILIQKGRMKFRDLCQLVICMEDKPESLSTNSNLYSFLKKNSNIFVLDHSESVHLEAMQIFDGRLKIDYSNFISFVQLDASKILVPGLNCECREYRRLCAAVNFLLHFFIVLHYSELKACIFYILKDIEIYLSEFDEDTQVTIFRCIPFTASEKYLFKLVKTSDIKMGFLTPNERFLLFVSCVLGFHDRIYFIELLKKYAEKHTENGDPVLADLTFSDQVKYLNSLYPCILLDDHYWVKMPEDFKFPNIEFEKNMSIQSYDEHCRNISWKCPQRKWGDWDKNCTPDETSIVDSSITDLDFRCILKKVCKKITSSIAYLLQYFSVKSFPRLLSIMFLVLDDVAWEFSALSVAKQSNILKECTSLFIRNHNESISLCLPDSLELCDLKEAEKDLLLISFIVSKGGELHYRKIFERYFELQGHFPRKLNTDSSHYSYLSDRNRIFMTRKNGYFQLRNLPSSFDSKILNSVELELWTENMNATDLNMNSISSNKSEIAKEIKDFKSFIKPGISEAFLISKSDFQHLSEKITENQLLSCIVRMKHGIFYLLNALKLSLTPLLFSCVAYVLADVRRIIVEMSSLDRDLVLNIAVFCYEDSNYNDYFDKYKMSTDLTDDEKKLLCIVAFLSEKKKVHYKDIFDQLESCTLLFKNFELPKDLCNYMLEWNEKFSVDSEGFVTLLLFSEISFYSITDDSFEDFSENTVTALFENEGGNSFLQTEFIQKLQTTLVFKEQLENMLSEMKTLNEAFIADYKPTIREIIATQMRSGIIYLSECFEVITYPYILSLVVHVFHNSETYFTCLPSIEKYDLVIRILKPLTFDKKGAILLNNAMCSKIYSLNNEEKDLLIFAYKLAISNEILLSDLILSMQEGKNHSSTALNSKHVEVSYFEKHNEVFHVLDNEHVKLTPFPKFGLKFKLFSQYFLLSPEKFRSLLMEDNLLEVKEKSCFSVLDQSQDTSVSERDDLIKQSERFGLIFSKALSEIANDSKNCASKLPEGEPSFSFNDCDLESDNSKIVAKIIKKIHVGLAFLSKCFECVAKSKPRSVLITMQCLDDVKKYLVALEPADQIEFINICLSSMVVKNGVAVYNSSLIIKLSNEEKLRLFSAYLLSFETQMHYKDIYTKLCMKTCIEIDNLSSIGKYISFQARHDIFEIHQEHVKLNPLFIIDMSRNCRAGNYNKSSDIFFMTASGSESSLLQFTDLKNKPKIQPKPNLDAKFVGPSDNEHFQPELLIDNTIHSLQEKATDGSERVISNSLTVPVASSNEILDATAYGSTSFPQLRDMKNYSDISPKPHIDTAKCMSISVTFENKQLKPSNRMFTENSQKEKVAYNSESVSSDPAYFAVEFNSQAFKRVTSGLVYLINLNIPPSLRVMKIIVLCLHDVRKLYVSLPPPNKNFFVAKCCEINYDFKNREAPLDKKEKCLLTRSEKELLCFAYALQQLRKSHYRKVFWQAIHVGKDVNHLLPDKDIFWYFKRKPEIFVITGDGFVKFVPFEFVKYRSKEYANSQEKILKRKVNLVSPEGEGVSHVKSFALERNDSSNHLQEKSDKISDTPNYKKSLSDIQNEPKISAKCSEEHKTPITKSYEQEKPIRSSTEQKKHTGMNHDQVKLIEMSSKQKKASTKGPHLEEATTKSCEQRKTIAKSCELEKPVRKSLEQEKHAKESHKEIFNEMQKVIFNEMRKNTFFISGTEKVSQLQRNDAIQNKELMAIQKQSSDTENLSNNRCSIDFIKDQKANESLSSGKVSVIKENFISKHSMIKIKDVSVQLRIKASAALIYKHFQLALSANLAVQAVVHALEDVKRLFMNTTCVDEISLCGNENDINLPYGEYLKDEEKGLLVFTCILLIMKSCHCSELFQKMKSLNTSFASDILKNNEDFNYFNQRNNYFSVTSDGYVVLKKTFSRVLLKFSQIMKDNSYLLINASKSEVRSSQFSLNKFDLLTVEVLDLCNHVFVDMRRKGVLATEASSRAKTASISSTDALVCEEHRTYCDNLVDSFLKCPEDKYFTQGTPQHSVFVSGNPESENVPCDKVVCSGSELMKVCAVPNLEHTTSNCDTAKNSVLNCSKKEAHTNAIFKTDSVSQDHTNVDKLESVHSPVLELRTLKFFIIILVSNNGVVPSFLYEKLKIASQEVQHYFKSKYPGGIITFFQNYPDVFHVSSFTKLIYLRSNAFK